MKQKTTFSSDKISNEFLEVNSCGIDRIKNCDMGSYRPYGRCDYHILYVERGVCNIVIDAQQQKFAQGTVVMFRPYEPQHYFYLQDDNSVSHYIHFTGVGCEHILKKLGIYDLKIFSMGKSASYEKLSEEMVREFIMRKPMYKDLCASYLYRLLSIIGRKYALRQINVNTKSESRINAACCEIYDSIKSPPMASELAKKSFLSVSRFLHLFKEVTGKSYSEFITFIRMERAKEMLSLTEMQVCDIAGEVGYDDQNYFSRCFRKLVGCSPTEYRNDSR